MYVSLQKYEFSPSVAFFGAKKCDIFYVICIFVFPKTLCMKINAVRKPEPALRDKVILGIDPGTNVLGYGVVRVRGRKVVMEAMGVIDLRKVGDVYLKLGRIYERIIGIIDSFLPDEMAIEAPFFGKNVQSMLKLGRAQGVAIAAAISRDVPIHEYAPLKIKMAITGNGQASKERVAGILQRLLNIPDESMLPYYDATDALAAAYCHYLQDGKEEHTGGGARSWKDFVKQNGSRVSGMTGPQQQLAEALCKKSSK